MAVFCCFETGAGKELAIENQAAAHTCADEETDHVVITFGSAIGMFTEYTNVDVIADIERDAKTGLDGRTDIIITPGQIRREQNDAGILVDNTGCTS